MNEPNTQNYPEPKTHELSESEKNAICVRLREGVHDVYVLASEFNCSPSQIAGIKAALSKQ